MYRRGIGVGEYVRVPDVGVTAREQSDAAANRDRIGRVPGETETRQNQVEVIQRRVVGKAVVGDKVRINVGLVARLVPVVSNTQGQLQPVSNLPLVLYVSRIHRVAPFNRGVALVVTDGVSVVDPSCLTRRKVLYAVEADLGIDVLVEQVVHLQVFALKAAGNRMIANGVITANHQLLDLPVQRVCLAAVVLAEIHVYLVELDSELREVLTRNRLLQEVDVTKGISDLGGETIIPVRVQIDVVSGELSTALVKVLIKFELIQIAIRGRVVERVVVHVSRRQAMRVVDIPVCFE